MPTLQIISACDQKMMPMEKVTGKMRNACGAYEHKGITTDRPPSWEKIVLLKMFLGRHRSHDPEGGDWVLWMDSDVLVTDPIKLTQYFEDTVSKLPKDKFLVLSRDANTYNCGVMWVRSCEMADEFFCKVWNLIDFVHCPWWEQAAIIALFIKYGRSYVDRHVEVVHKAPFNAYDPMFYKDGWYDPERDFALHYRSDWNMGFEQRLLAILKRASGFL